MALTDPFSPFGGVGAVVGAAASSSSHVGEHCSPQNPAFSSPHNYVDAAAPVGFVQNNILSNNYQWAPEQALVMETVMP